MWRLQVLQTRARLGSNSVDVLQLGLVAFVVWLLLDATVAVHEVRQLPAIVLRSQKNVRCPQERHAEDAEEALPLVGLAVRITTLFPEHGRCTEILQHRR